MTSEVGKIRAFSILQPFAHYPNGEKGEVALIHQL